MKLHLASTGSLNTVTAYGAGFVEINAKRFDAPIVFAPDSDVRPWDATTFDTLAEVHFESVLALAPEIVLLGTGIKQRFLHPRVLAPLNARRIGVETMDVQAACRTYNVLMSEGRRVVAALLFE